MFLFVCFYFRCIISLFIYLFHLNKQEDKQKALVEMLARQHLNERQYEERMRKRMDQENKR